VDQRSWQGIYAFMFDKGWQRKLIKGGHQETVKSKRGKEAILAIHRE